MKRLLIILGLLAGAACLEAPDDYLWEGIKNGTVIEIGDVMYTLPQNHSSTVSASFDSDPPAPETTGKKI
jgi:hypothetical protein